MRELHDEGHLERRAASGTFAPGQSSTRNGVQLVFNRRAERSESFGERLLRELTTRLENEKIAHSLTFADEEISLDESRFCVVWESSAAIALCLKARVPALLLNDRPPPGLTSSLVDSVSCDDFCGGASAAQLLMKSFAQARNESEGNNKSKKSDGKKAKKARRQNPRFAILSGPLHDVRSDQRVAGFLSQMPDTKVIAPRGWFVENGLQVADRVLESGRDGVFCCNDRLAEAILQRCRERDLPRPRLVGFDDAPIAQVLELTTLAMPWDEMLSGALSVIKTRLRGDDATACHLIYTPRLVKRTL